MDLVQFIEKLEIYSKFKVIFPILVAKVLLIIFVPGLMSDNEQEP